MSVCVVEGQRLSDVMRLGCSRDETAYHEAGHAAIELIYGFTPKLLLIKDRGGEISGDCFSCAPTGQEQLSLPNCASDLGTTHAGRVVGDHAKIPLELGPGDVRLMMILDQHIPFSHRP